MENQFTESGEAIFPALILLVHFRKSLHGISRESLLAHLLLDLAENQLWELCGLIPPPGYMEL